MHKILNIMLWVTLFISILLSAFFIDKLEVYNNVAVLGFDRPIPVAMQKIIASSRIDETDAYSFINRHAGIRAEYMDRAVDDISVYACQQGFTQVIPITIVHGSFIMDTGIYMRQRCVVIDETLAWKLFAVTDCVGKTLKIGNDAYIITGVYRQDKGLPGLLSARENHAAYIHIQTDSFLNSGEGSLAVKCDPGMASIALGKLSTNLPGSVKQVNLDVLARSGAMLAEFLMTISLLLVFLWLSREWLNMIIPYIWRKQHIHNHGDEGIIILSLSTAAIVMIIVLLAVIANSLYLVIDPRIIPESLINYRYIIDKLSSWIWQINNGSVTGGILYPEVKALSQLAVIPSVGSLIIAISITYGEKKASHK